MLKVITFGVWDLLHVGHLDFLERAAALGDWLAVGVPTDLVVVEDKGAAPVIPFLHRLRMVGAIKCVAAALPYYSLDFVPLLGGYRPQVLAVGAQWGDAVRHVKALEWCAANGCRVVRLPRYAGVDTTSIKAKIIRGCK